MVDLKNYNAKRMHMFFSNHLRMTALMVGMAVFVSVFVFNMQKNIVVVVNGKPTEISTYKTTVKSALKSADIGVGKGDSIIPGLDSKVTEDMTIRIKKAIPVSLRVDGKQLKIYTNEKTIGEALKAQGIKLNKSDIISPKLQAAVVKDMKIKVTRFTENTVTMTKNVAHKVFSKADKKLDKGKVKVLRAGIDGVKEQKYKVIYKDGKEVDRFLVSETIKKAPIDKIVAVGSLAWFAPTKSARRVYYTNQLRVKATSYTADYACTGKRPGDRGFGRTATGKMARRNVNGYSTVAVDKSVIPLGTKLYIEGYGYAIAEDVGGGVRGRHIDLYFAPGTSEYRNWFTHSVKVYVLK